MLVDVFDTVCRELGISERIVARDTAVSAVSDTVAITIMDLARQGVREHQQLRQLTLQKFGKANEHHASPTFV